MDRLRQELRQLREQKRVTFHELDRLIQRIVRQYAGLFPNFRTKEKGSRVVYHFGVPDVDPISLEREHRGRDCVLPKYAKLAMNHIEDLLVFVESRL